MSNEKIYTDLCDKNGKKLYIGDNIRFTVKPFNYVYKGEIILADGGIFIEYLDGLLSKNAVLLIRRPLYKFYDVVHHNGATIDVRYIYEKIDNE